MKKELEKVYDPKQVEDQDLSVLDGKRLFPRRAKSPKEALYDCDPPTQYHGTVASGPCVGLHAAGQYHSL